MAISHRHDFRCCLGARAPGSHELDYVEGQNLAIEYRFEQGQSKSLDELAAELVHLGPAVIVTVGTQAALAAKRATTTISIVMATVGEPLRTGLVTSFARPGGNMTGVTLFGDTLSNKRLELFKEMVPSILECRGARQHQQPH